MARTLLLLFAALLGAGVVQAADRPNIILIFADDISARELPIYDSSVWSPPAGGNTSDHAYRAQTPVLDRLAREGLWVTQAWAAVVCSPSRAMMMTGRYAHLHKWWENGDYGRTPLTNERSRPWFLYESSPTLIGHVAQQGGYATYWAGKTQMKGSDLRQFGFDSGAFTPGEDGSKLDPDNPFKLVNSKIDGKQTLVNLDTGESVTSYAQSSWYWRSHVQLMNDPSAPGKIVTWPNTPAAQRDYGPETYGPDVELDHIFRFMERQKQAGKPFFVYHTSHLGHDAFDWLHPAEKNKWPGTPIVHWDGERYTRTPPRITGSHGVYDTHSTVTGPGIHHHIDYLDYQVWLYLNKLRELGLDQNTMVIFCADNGTSGYGKNSPDRQKGVHVPLIIYAPGLGLTRHGRQDVLVNMADMLPTIAELTGVELPAEYEVNGESLVPFLFGDKPTHREWVYGYKGEKQIIRGAYVMRDGNGKWWDVSASPADMISFPAVTDWSQVSAAHRAERDRLTAILPRFNRHDTAHDAPEFRAPPQTQPRAEKENRVNDGSHD